MRRLRYFARARVPKTKVCWSVLNVEKCSTVRASKESNRIGMDDKHNVAMRLVQLLACTHLTVNAVSSFVAI